MLKSIVFCNILLEITEVEKSTLVGGSGAISVHFGLAQRGSAQLKLVGGPAPANVLFSSLLTECVPLGIGRGQLFEFVIVS